MPELYDRIAEIDNFAVSELQENLSAVGTTVKVLVADAGLFPTPSVANDKVFPITLYDGVQAPEICFVTAKSGGDLTVERGREGSSAVAWQAGTKVRLGLTKESIMALARTMSLGIEYFAAEIDQDLTLPIGYNAQSVGPVSIATGVTVVVPVGARWVVN